MSAHKQIDQFFREFRAFSTNLEVECRELRNSIDLPPVPPPRGRYPSRLMRELGEGVGESSKKVKSGHSRVLNSLSFSDILEQADALMNQNEIMIEQIESYLMENCDYIPPDALDLDLTSLDETDTQSTMEEVLEMKKTGLEKVAVDAPYSHSFLLIDHSGRNAKETQSVSFDKPRFSDIDLGIAELCLSESSLAAIAKMDKAQATSDRFTNKENVVPAFTSTMSDGGVPSRTTTSSLLSTPAPTPSKKATHIAVPEVPKQLPAATPSATTSATTSFSSVITMAQQPQPQHSVALDVPLAHSAPVQQPSLPDTTTTATIPIPPTTAPPPPPTPLVVPLKPPSYSVYSADKIRSLYGGPSLPDSSLAGTLLPQQPSILPPLPFSVPTTKTTTQATLPPLLSTTAPKGVGVGAQPISLPSAPAVPSSIPFKSPSSKEADEGKEGAIKKISEVEFGTCASYLRSQVTLEELNKAVTHMNSKITGCVTKQEFDELLGEKKSKVIILLLLNLKRVSSELRDGEVLYLAVHS